MGDPTDPLPSQHRFATPSLNDTSKSDSEFSLSKCGSWKSLDVSKVGIVNLIKQFEQPIERADFTPKPLKARKTEKLPNNIKPPSLQNPSTFVENKKQSTLTGEQKLHHNHARLEPEKTGSFSKLRLDDIDEAKNRVRKNDKSQKQPSSEFDATFPTKQRPIDEAKTPSKRLNKSATPAAGQQTSANPITEPAPITEVQPSIEKTIQSKQINNGTIDKRDDLTQSINNNPAKTLQKKSDRGDSGVISKRTTDLTAKSKTPPNIQTLEAELLSERTHVLAEHWTAKLGVC